MRVPIEAIDRIEAARDYVLLNTATKCYILRARMTEIEQRIDPKIMIRIHRSHMAVSYTHLDVYKRQSHARPGHDPEDYAYPLRG